MEVDTGSQQKIVVSFRKLKVTITYITGSTGTIKRKFGVWDVEFLPKKQCVKRDTIIKFKPASFEYKSTNSNSYIPTAIYRPFQLKKMCDFSFHRRRIKSIRDNFEYRLAKATGLANLSTVGNYCMKHNDQYLSIEDELSNKFQKMSLSDRDYHARKIEDAILLFAKKKLPRGTIGFRSEDVQEFCTDMIMDLEKWLQEQYEETLESKLKEQHLNYQQFKNDYLNTINVPEFGIMAMDDYSTPDYLY